jgi:molybdate transport system substrate-binding protein
VTRHARLLTWIFALATLMASNGTAGAEEPRKPELLVFAAASLADVLGALSPGWERTSGIPARLSFASSAILARQIEAGGKAEVFISADDGWMNYLQERSLISNATRRNLAANRLVLIAPADSRLALKIRAGFPLLAALGTGRLSVADPEIVPAGRYAKTALTSLGVWNAVEDRLALADNVRSALLFVARGETPLGIVYATDARIDSKVRVVDVFPESTHAPIRYPAAAMKNASTAATRYLNYLGSRDAAASWKKFGFLETTK